MVNDVAFLVTSSNSFPLPISTGLDLSVLSFSQPELIQVPISEEQNDSYDAAISQLVTRGTREGAGKRGRRGACKLGAIDLNRKLRCPESLLSSILHFFLS